MANAKQVLDVQVSKGITAAQGNEHLRNRSEEAEKYAMSKGNYDPTRKHLNFEIVPGGKVRPIDTSRNIPERIADILGRRGIKDPNEGLVEPKYRTVVNIISAVRGSGCTNSLSARRRWILKKVRTIPASKEERHRTLGEGCLCIRLRQIRRAEYSRLHCTPRRIKSARALYASANQRREVCVQGDIRRKGQVRI